MNVDKPISFNVLEDDDINFIKVIHDTFVPTYFFPLFTFVFQVKLLNVTTFNVGLYMGALSCRVSNFCQYLYSEKKTTFKCRLLWQFFPNQIFNLAIKLATIN